MGRLSTCVLNFFVYLDDILYISYNTVSLKPFWLKGGGVWGPAYPRKNLTEFVRNHAILDNSGGYTTLVIMSQ